MKRILIFIAAAALMAVSCEEKIKNTPVDVTVSLQMNGEAYAAADITVTLRELNGTASYEAATNADGTATFSVLAGLYEASTTFKVAAEGSLFVYNGLNTNVVVSNGAENGFSLELVESKSNQIVIKELYCGGCPADDGSKSFQNDGYVILYNNSDTPADASDICFAYATPTNSNVARKYLVDGELSYIAEGWIPAGWATWWFQRNVTIEPFSQIVVALCAAVDHTATYSNSVDLSKADYAMYDPEVFANAKYVVSESIPETNYLKTFAYAPGNAWPLSVNSPAFYIYRNDANAAYTSDPANYDYTMGEKMPDVKVMLDWVVDGVDVFRIGYEDKNGKRLPASVDAGSCYFINGMGYSVYRNVDKAATEALEGNEGKLVYDYAGGTADLEGSTDPSGIDAEKSIANGARIVYMDTNNSTNDFHQRKFASLTGK